MSDQSSAVTTFNPALAGTPELCWQRALDEAPDWLPPPRPLLIVSPHPDDEVLGAGGLIRAHAQAGFEVTVLSVTDGEAAYENWAELGRVRRAELHKALCMLAGDHVTTIHLGIPDGQVDKRREFLYAAMETLIAHKPTIVAPYELDGHPDHDATGAVCGEIARRHGLTLVQFPIWTWHHSAPENRASAQWARLTLDEDTQYAKAQAIDCFASQLRPIGRQPIVPSHVLPYFERSFEAFLL